MFTIHAMGKMSGLISNTEGPSVESLPSEKGNYSNTMESLICDNSAWEGTLHDAGRFPLPLALALADI